MKKFKFLQAALIGRGGLKTGGHGHTYHAGVHEVPEKHQEDPTFKHFAKHGLIVPFKAQESTELPSAKSDIAKLSQEVATKSQQLAPDAEIGGEPDFGDEAEEPKHGKKHKKEK